MIFRIISLMIVILSCSIAVRAQVHYRGRVLDKSSGTALPGAHIRIVNSPKGGVTDANGYFDLSRPDSSSFSFRISATGYLSAEFSATTFAGDTLDFFLEPTADLLDEVVVTATMKEVRLSDSPLPVTVISPSFLKKNPAPSLFESLANINGVRPQINCSVCNTGDIHINGMEGPYTMVLIDGMPIVSGLASVYGLFGIPTSLVERIEIVKGPASSLYGSEAMGGIINVITRSALNAPQFSIDLMGTGWQEMNLDAGLKLKAGKHHGLFGLNVFHYDNPIDNNNDGFTDLTQQQRFSVFNKWDFYRKNARRASLAARYVYEDRWGGQMAWTPAFRGGDSLYGESIYTSRAELIGHYDLAIGKEIIVLQGSFSDHRQNSVYGTTIFIGTQRIGFGQARWEKRIGRHELLSGAGIRHTFYDDSTPATEAAGPNGTTTRPEITLLPGIFIQDEFRINGKNLLLSGMRVDHHPEHGFIPSPRISHRWKKSDRFFIRSGVGNGFRVVNVFTEDHAALSGSREVIITEDLRPERSWNAYSNAVHKFFFRRSYLQIEMNAFASVFSNKILPDYTTNDEQIIYSNLRGHVRSVGCALNVEYNFNEKIRLFAGATFADIQRIENGMQTRPPLSERFSGSFSLSYRPASRWTIDYTGNVTGSMLLPLQDNDFRPEKSPVFSIQNIQISYKPAMAWNVYFGVKNLLNYTPPAWSIMRAHDPFDKDADNTQLNPFGYRFDATYVYTSFQGIRMFLGIRYQFK